MTTDEMLGESIELASRRERESFDRLVKPTNGRIVLFGAGKLGRKLLSALRREGVEPLGFADNNLALQRQRVDGLLVHSVEEAAQQWGLDALFVVSIFHPDIDQGMASRLARLVELGCRWVISFLPLAWRFPGVLPHYGANLPSKLLAQSATLRNIYDSLGDDHSKKIFRQQLAWRLRGDFSEVSPPSPDQYFPRDLIKSDPREVFIDGGAFDGDTLRKIPWPFARSLAAEPDPASASILRNHRAPNVEVIETALGNVAGKIRFDASGTKAAA